MPFLALAARGELTARDPVTAAPLTDPPGVEGLSSIEYGMARVPGHSRARLDTRQGKGKGLRST